ncbi:hypothetical protein NC652_007814 [Populus alba x Populus x berolinensis]|nr:hypothetical protein NC652_007814 [Populus alba x Populus x berolinensis]
MTNLQMTGILEKHRDIASIALKTIVSEVTAQYLWLNPILVTVISTVDKRNNNPVSSKVSMCQDDHEVLLNAAFVPIEFRNQATIRKKTVSCIGKELE